MGAGVIGLLLATAFWVGRRLWFFSDDWNILADYHSGNLLEPFNGHLSLLPAGAYQVLFHTVGLGSYLPYRLCGLVALGILGFQVLRYARGRVGPWAAVVAVAAVMWNSYGNTNVMFPFLMNFSLPIAALVAIWWHLDRARSAGSPAEGPLAKGFTRDDAAAGVWLAVALAASGLGVMTLGAVVVELAVTRAPWRRWVAFAPASGLWLAWWVGHREANDIATDLPRVATYALQMMWGGTTALAAGSKPLGLVLAAALVALLVVGATRWHSLDGRVLGALAAALAFAGLTALTRLDVRPSIPPDELRYGWTIGAYLVLAALAAWRPSAADRERAGTAGARWWRPAAFALAVGVLAVGAVRLVGDMGSWTDMVAGAAPGLRANLYAAEAAGAERVGPDAVIRPLSFVPVTAQSYLGAVADVGSPLQGATRPEIGGRPDQREAADRLLFGAVHPTLRTALPGARGTSPDRTGCASTITAAAGRVVTVVGGDPVAAPGTVAVSRFSDGTGAEVEVARPGAANELVLPADATVGTDAVVPYRLRATPGLLLCAPR